MPCQGGGLQGGQSLWPPGTLRESSLSHSEQPTPASYPPAHNTEHGEETHTQTCCVCGYECRAWIDSISLKTECVEVGSVNLGPVMYTASSYCAMKVIMPLNITERVCVCVCVCVQVGYSLMQIL